MEPGHELDNKPQPQARLDESFQLDHEEDDYPPVRPPNPNMLYFENYKDEEEAPTAIVADPWRWPVLVAFSLYSSANAFQWVCYSVVPDQAKEYFSLNTFQLNMLSTIYMIIFAIGCYFTCTTFERFGVRSGLLIGGAFNAVGSILKITLALLKPSYTTTMVAQVFCAIAQLWVLSTPPLIASQYFPQHRRGFATAIMTTANNLGNAVGLIVPPFMVLEATKADWLKLFGLQMAYSVGVFILAIFLVRPPRCRSKKYRSQYEKEIKVSEPLHEASTDDVLETQSKEPEKPKGNFFQRMIHSKESRIFIHVALTIAQLMKQRDFAFLLVAFSSAMTSVWVYAAVIAQVLAPLGVSSQLAGIAGAMNIVAGTIAAYLVGLYIGHSKRYRVPLIIALFGSLICCVALIILMKTAVPGSNLMIGMSVFLYIFVGIFQNTAAPISLEFAMELSYPLPDSVPGTFFMGVADILSMVLVLVCAAILGDDTPTVNKCMIVFILVTALCFLGAIFGIFPRERLYRSAGEEYEKKLEAYNERQAAKKNGNMATTEDQDQREGGGQKEE
ncbi:Major Facilitator Superfamily/Sugar (and other) transporter, putative [Angomonas deanei]|uniref:Major Facilitator Superfamily/Sugar (And other) transporter, putative n=1 Tax=Angomonas deanei TaxID=59799 RepID=A0A7G2CP31_9TRYP|nr:Major Facilitator Superfamily/Sugar (and other) transporter, putative [Angomonas deanei]